MNIQRILLSALLGATLVVTAACGTDAAQQAKSEVGKDVKVETKMPSFDATPIADEYATIHTNKGDIKVRLYGSKAPITVKNFISLIIVENVGLPFFDKERYKCSRFTSVDFAAFVIP